MPITVFKGESGPSKKEMQEAAAKAAKMRGTRAQNIGFARLKNGGEVNKRTPQLTSGLRKGKAAAAPKPEPRAKSAVPNAGKAPVMKLASGGVAKYRKSVTDTNGKPNALPKPPKVPVNKGAMKKGRNVI